jgi:hypothetical protein
MGSDRGWQVMEMTAYRSENSVLVYLVYVHPVGVALPALEDWDGYYPEQNNREVLNIWFA